MGLWRVFQLEESQFGVKEVSKANGSNGASQASTGDVGGTKSNLPGYPTDFCHNVLSQLGKYASSRRGGWERRGPSRASVNTYALMSGRSVIIFQVAG